MNRTRRGAILAIVALTLTLTGCVRVVSDITLHDDNTVSGELLFAVEKGAGASMELTDEQLIESLTQGNPADQLVNATVTPYDQDGYIGTQISFTDEPIAGFVSLDSSITREGDTFVFVGPTPSGADTALASPDAVATMSVTFPGQVGDHNGTLEGTTVTWNLLTLTEQPHATGSAIAGGAAPAIPGGSNAALYFIIGGAVLLVLIAAGLIILGQRKRSARPAST